MNKGSMTTNHPAHGPVSLDRLHQIREILSKAAAQSDGGNLGYAMADAVKVIDGVMAIPETLPCPVLLEPGLKFGKGVQTRFVLAALRRRADYYAELEAMTPEQRAEHDAGIAEFKAMIGHDSRSAMLQAGNHTEQRLDMVEHSGDANENVDGRLPFDQWLSQQNEPIDVDCGCVTTEAFYHWLRVAYEAGNSPVAPDGWIPVSDRMPNQDQPVLVWVNEEGVYVDYGDGENFANHHIVDVTHWMPLPAAPKQEVKSALEHGMQRYAVAMQKLSEGDK